MRINTLRTARYYRQIIIFATSNPVDTMWKEKLGNYLIDISKYIFTGVVIASLFKDMEDNKWLIYGLGFTSALLALILGLILTNKKKEE